MYAFFIRTLEGVALRGGCVADTWIEQWQVRVYGALAARYADQLSDCAKAFFGI